jgi:hypothetical protein
MLEQKRGVIVWTRIKQQSAPLQGGQMRLWEGRA